MTSKVTWDDLRVEFEDIGGPGELWRAEIKKICQYRIKQKMNLRLSAELFGFVDWDADDLAQTVITERLLARGQARFIFDTVEDIDHARKLLSNEVSFTLEDRRVPNQVDNVMSNLEPRLRELGWSPEGKGTGNNSEEDARRIKEIARQILNLKRLRNRGQQRLSPLFAGETLAGLAKQIVKEHPQVSAYVIQQALRTALAKISPRVSMEAVGNTQEDFGVVAGLGALKWVDDLDSAEGLSADAARILEVLGSEGSEISFLIASGASQNEIAGVLGVSRPTAVKRIEQTEELLMQEFKSIGFDDDHKLRILGEVFSVLGVGISDGEIIK